MATFSKADQALVKEGGGRMNDKQRVELMKKYGRYNKGMHPDSTMFGADGNVLKHGLNGKTPAQRIKEIFYNRRTKLTTSS